MPLEYWWRCRNYWCDYCFDAPGFVAFSEFVDTALLKGLQGHLAYALCVAPTRTSFALDLRRWRDRRQYTLGLFYSVPVGDNEASDLALQNQRRALERCLELGGRPYLYGCCGGRNGLEQVTLEQVYGAPYLQLKQLRSQFDPLGLMNPNSLN
jgi:hypothetical protein